LESLTEIPISAAKEITPFDRFKTAYPKRDGSNPWQPAQRKFETLVKHGVDPEMIIRGARQLAVELHKARQIGTRFVPQALTWLNQQRYADCADSLPAAAADQTFPWDTVISNFKKWGRWSPQAGPDPDSPACRCPREILQRHGLR
jgi:hypothetical protein